nr:uncharacterized protein LOC131774826 [Pocillopora verrucosa]
MEKGKTWWPSPNWTSNDSSRMGRNQTEAMDPVYVFTPAGNTAKHVLCLVLSVIGTVGFVGNCSLFYFLWQKKTTSPIQKSRFVRSLNLYMRSLSLSDLLSCSMSLPFLCLQILFDLMQSGWLCKMVRYLNFVFPAITINNLVVISLAKYLSTRKNPYTLGVTAVRRMIIGAWILGIATMLLPAATFDGVAVRLNDSHFTVICRYNQNFYPFQITAVIFPLQYVIPGIFITYVNACLLKTLWIRTGRQIRHAKTSAFKAKLTVTRIRATYLLISLTFAFICPYFVYIGNTAYTQIMKPQRSFSTDYIVRYVGGSIGAYFSSALNFIIYFVQIKDFRAYLRNNFRSRCIRINT